MKHLLIGLMALSALICATQVVAQFQRLPSQIVPYAPELSARAWALLEVNSGWIVAGVNEDQPFAPASITKLVTTYVAFDALKIGLVSLDDAVEISEKAWRMRGSRMFAEVNTRIALERLLKSVIIQSGNDAAVAIAEHLAGSELAFAAQMNRVAEQLGMRQAHFENASGWPAAGHQMSPRDILIIANALITQFPQYYGWYSEKAFEHNGILQTNRNKLLWKDKGVDGLKTGHTEAAGYCLVASAEREGERWIAVVMGTSSESVRENEVTTLLEFGFNAFSVKELFVEQSGVAQAQVFGGETDSVRLHAAEPVWVVVPRDREDELLINLNIAPDSIAPIKVGQALGVASVSLDGTALMDVPLVAMSEIPQGGLFKRAWDWIKRSTQGVLGL